MGDGVEGSVIAWYSTVVECQRHACTHISWLRESHIIKEVSLIEKVSENYGVDMLWHLVVIVPKPPQTPKGFGLDAIPHHPSLTHIAIDSRHRVACHTMRLFTV